MQTTDIPTWLGILLFIAGIVLTVAMAKWVAHRERTSSEIKTKSEG